MQDFSWSQGRSFFSKSFNHVADKALSSKKTTAAFVSLAALMGAYNFVYKPYMKKRSPAGAAEKRSLINEQPLTQKKIKDEIVDEEKSLHNKEESFLDEFKKLKRDDLDGNIDFYRRRIRPLYSAYGIDINRIGVNEQTSSFGQNIREYGWKKCVGESQNDKMYRLALLDLVIKIFEHATPEKHKQSAKEIIESFEKIKKEIE